MLIIAAPTNWRWSRTIIIAMNYLFWSEKVKNGVILPCLAGQNNAVLDFLHLLSPELAPIRRSSASSAIFVPLK